MRIFLPLTATDLLSPAVPDRPAIGIDRNPGEDADQLDDRYEEAMAEAAFHSLALLMEDSEAPAFRIVGVAEVSDGGRPPQWEQFDSFHVDDDAAASLVRDARVAATQEDLDGLVERLQDTSLEWFDVSELAALRRRFAE